jgi:hypothetical protein
LLRNRSIAELAVSSRGQPIFRLLHARRFSGRTSKKALVVYEPNRISFSQVYPFMHYHHAFANAHDVEFRFVEKQRFLSCKNSEWRDATHVFLQSWLTDELGELVSAYRLIRDSVPGALITYLDSFANSDIRLARHIEEIDFYYKKSLFTPLDCHLAPTLGDTNLEEFYGERYGIGREIVDWKIPPSIIPKLRLAPGFLTDAGLMEWLISPVKSLDCQHRDIDIHARLGGIIGDGWYSEMRREAERYVHDLQGVTVAVGTGVGQKVFRQELERSKICFSPFGYGELCWRDIEAFAAGAVLLKPDMSHLKTEPDLYRDGETYVSIRWDFSDLAEKVTAILADDTLRRAIAERARNDARSYLVSGGPVAAYAPVFFD